MFNNEPRTVEESYTVACSTSDMRVEAERRGDADVIIAAGWSPSRLGGALRRLHGEWDMVEHPARPTRGQIEVLMSTYPVDENGHPNAKARSNMAKEQAFGWYANELSMLLGKLKSLPGVKRELIAVVSAWGMQDAGMKASEVLGWWLHQGCPVCNKTKWEIVPNTNRQSGRSCRACQGSGITPAPHGQDGKRIAKYLDEAKDASLGSIQRRLRNYPHHTS